MDPFLVSFTTYVITFNFFSRTEENLDVTKFYVVTVIVVVSFMTRNKSTVQHKRLRFE